MKVKGLIFWAVILSFSGLYSNALAKVGEDTIAVELSNLKQIAKNLQDQTIAPVSPWPDLQSFHHQLFRAMAMDPAPGAAVPPSQVPKELWSNALNEELTKKFEEIKESKVATSLHVEKEFEDYSNTVTEMMSLRTTRQFPQARALAKKGQFDDRYEQIMKALAVNSAAGFSGAAGTEAKGPKDLKKLDDTIKNLQSAVEAEMGARHPFLSGGKFILYAAFALLSAMVGILVHKKIDPAKIARAPKPIRINLNYEQWLQEFEVHLSHLKATQQSQERRMEELVNQSEKISRQALALYADARIQADANVEHRMNNLLCEIQQNFEESKKFQASDRVPVREALGHALKLCDVIESLRSFIVQPEKSGNPETTSPQEAANKKDAAA